MVSKKILYVFSGFIAGFVLANVFFSTEVMAQYGVGGARPFSEEEMATVLPAEYGKLVAVSGVDMYFQGEDGSVYIVKPRNKRELDPVIYVVKRGR